MVVPTSRRRRITISISMVIYHPFFRVTAFTHLTVETMVIGFLKILPLVFSIFSSFWTSVPTTSDASAWTALHVPILQGTSSMEPTTTDQVDGTSTRVGSLVCLLVFLPYQYYGWYNVITLLSVTDVANWPAAHFALFFCFVCVWLLVFWFAFFLLVSLFGSPSIVMAISTVYWSCVSSAFCSPPSTKMDDVNKLTDMQHAI